MQKLGGRASPAAARERGSVGWEKTNYINKYILMEEIALDPIIQDFDEFFDDKTNTRIILSGPFGIGKTYFLEKFFKEKQSDKYLPVVIRPINYAILQNEDVFKFIQYDILKEILSNETFPHEEIEKKIQSRVKKGEIIKSSLPTLFNLLKAIPKLGEFASAGEELYKLFKNIKEVESKDGNALNTLTDEVESLYLNAFEDTGAIIKQYLQKLSEKKSDNNSIQKVLIIDDLDRLDPDHIFRIFNVFSAYLDKQIWKNNNSKNTKNSEETKTIFGFDKVVISCDIENIRRIFHHKYGTETDFDGYIDKFYSKRFYSFNHAAEKVYNSLKIELNSIFTQKEFTANKELVPQLLTNLLFSGNDIQ
ncbi:MAG: P-loop NTPase fold protein [Bacteroidales bacterium]